MVAIGGWRVECREHDTVPRGYGASAQLHLDSGTRCLRRGCWWIVLALQASCLCLLILYATPTKNYLQISRLGSLYESCVGSCRFSWIGGEHYYLSYV